MKYSRTIIAVGLLLILSSTPGLAQEKKFEVIPVFGYTASSGVNIEPVDLGGGLTADRIKPKNGFNFGVTFNVAATENVSLGFAFSRNNSNLQVRVTDQAALLAVKVDKNGYTDLADMKVYNYHGLLTFNAFDQEAPVRPYVTLGLGLTNYRSRDPFIPTNLPSPAPNVKKVDSLARFSPTFGGGVKFFLHPNVGLQASAHWIPTRITKDPDGIWCSSFWPWRCYVLEKRQYSHQGQFTGGLIFRF